MKIEKKMRKRGLKNIFFNLIIKFNNIFKVNSTQHLDSSDQHFSDHVRQVFTVFGRANEQDIDEFRHTFFRADQAAGAKKIKYIKRQKPFKPTTKQQAPDPFIPHRNDIRGRGLLRSPPPFSDDQSMSQE